MVRFTVAELISMPLVPRLSAFVLLTPKPTWLTGLAIRMPAKVELVPRLGNADWFAVATFESQTATSEVPGITPPTQELTSSSPVAFVSFLKISTARALESVRNAGPRAVERMDALAKMEFVLGFIGLVWVLFGLDRFELIIGN